jgi:putative membrane protein
MHERIVDYGSQWFWVHTITRLVFLAAVIAGVILLVRYLANRPPQGTTTMQQPPSPSHGAMQILEERFARGEIDESEFRSRRDALRGG